MYKLVLVRHGQSEWNLENRFTGWTDVNLSIKGEEEAKNAGMKLKAAGFNFDLAFSSVLKRANKTLDLILGELNENPKIIYSWRLNERHYGALQGLNKKETAEIYGDAQVHEWRRSATTRPPELSVDDPRNPVFDKKYNNVDKSLLPRCENLIDTLNRVIVIYDEEIKPAILAGRKIIIAAHGNSLRALIMHLENLNSEEIMNVEIPTGSPLVYELDEKLKVISKYYL